MSKSAIESYFRDLGLEKVFKDILENDTTLLDSMAERLSEGKSISEQLRKVLNYSAAYTPLTNNVLISQFNLKGSDEAVKNTCDAYRRGIIGDQTHSKNKLKVLASSLQSELYIIIEKFLDTNKDFNYPAIQILIYNSTYQPDNLLGLLILNLKYLGLSTKPAIDVFSLTNTITNAGLEKANLNNSDKELSHEGLTPGRASAEVYARALRIKASQQPDKNVRQALYQMGAMVEANIDKYINSTISALVSRSDNRVDLVQKRKSLSQKIDADLKTTIKSKTMTNASSTDGGILKILDISCLIYVKESKESNQAVAKLVESPAGTRIFSRAIQREIFKSKVSYVDLETSPSYRKLIEKKLVDSLEGRSTNYNSTTTASTTSSTTIDINSKRTKTSKKESTKVTGKTKVIKPKGTIRNISGQFTSLPKILAMLQGNINQQVASNMGSPRLNYRKGRFANSVRINNVNRSDKGQWTITYSYMTYPYQTFEPGYAQGSNARDPRALITLSIRELVAKEIGNKFRAIRIGGAGSLGRIK